MGHMKIETLFGDWYQIESTEGTDFVPIVYFEFDVHVEPCLRTKSSLPELRKSESDPVTITKLFDRWGARYSAPGYLDCTEWMVGDSEQAEADVKADCEAQYWEDEDGEDES